jgi:glycosyltransferase involved in cell wall biosynthesis
VTPVNQSFYADVARQTGWDIELVVPAHWNTEYTSNLEVSRWPDFSGDIHAIPVWKSGSIPLHLYKQTMIGLLRKMRPDAIYMHHEPYGLATAQVYLANKVAGNCPIGFYAAQNILKTYPIPFRWFESLVFGSSAFCLPVTEGALEVLRQKGYSGKATVLPLALDANIYQPKHAWATAKRAELGIGDDEFVIGYLGRLVEEKGLQKMLEAAASLKDKKWRCVLVGNGPEEANLRALAAKLEMEDRVIFAGFVRHEEAPGWLSLFDVLVLASEARANWKEQFGRVILEANACETAVIGTESGEIGNVLRNTEGGLIVPEGDVALLAKALRCLAEDPGLRKSMASRGASLVREKYDQNFLASQFIDTIRAVTK